jgi:hypothetical protein
MHGKTEPSLQDRDGCLARDACSSVVTVMLGVMTACLDVVMFGVTGVAIRNMSMVGGLLVIAGLMMFGGLAMVLRRVLVMFGGLVMMFDTLVIAHVSLPVWRLTVRKTYVNRLTLC